MPYYLKWILECYGYLKRSLEEKIHNEEKDEFLRTLTATHEQWQVKQADYAIKLYNYFLSKTNTRQASSVPEEWERIEAETRKAIRLGHLSYRTEKTYIAWLRRFRAFVGERFLPILCSKRG